MSNKEFFAAFLLLVGFGVVVLATLYLFGEWQYFLFALVAQVLILGNLLLWRYFFKKSFLQIFIKHPFFLFLFYFLKFSVILLGLAIAYRYLL